MTRTGQIMYMYFEKSLHRSYFRLCVRWQTPTGTISTSNSSYLAHIM